MLLKTAIRIRILVEIQCSFIRIIIRIYKSAILYGFAFVFTKKEHKNYLKE